MPIFIYWLPRKHFYLVLLYSYLTSDTIITGPDDNFLSFSLKFSGILPISLLSIIYPIYHMIVNLMTIIFL